MPHPVGDPAIAPCRHQAGFYGAGAPVSASSSPFSTGSKISSFSPKSPSSEETTGSKVDHIVVLVSPEIQTTLDIAGSGEESC